MTFQHPGDRAIAVSHASRRRLLAFLAVVGAAGNPALALAQPAPDLAVGQEWSIKATPPTPAKVIIGRIELWIGGMTVVSVSIVEVPTPHGPSMIEHAPFERSALVGSLDQLVGTGRAPAPDFAQSYREWQAAHGGIFTISVDKVIGIFLDTIHKLEQQQTPPAGS